jgi:hypothetical protein
MQSTLLQNVFLVPVCRFFPQLMFRVSLQVHIYYAAKFKDAAASPHSAGSETLEVRCAQAWGRPTYSCPILFFVLRGYERCGTLSCAADEAV